MIKKSTVFFSKTLRQELATLPGLSVVPKPMHYALALTPLVLGMAMAGTAKGQLLNVPFGIGPDSIGLLHPDEQLAQKLAGFLKNIQRVETYIDCGQMGLAVLVVKIFFISVSGRKFFGLEAITDSDAVRRFEVMKEFRGA